MRARKTVLVTGADGLIGKNLSFRLREIGRYGLRPITRESTDQLTGGALPS